MFSTAVANDGDPPFDFDPGSVSVIVGAVGYQGVLMLDQVTLPLTTLSVGL